MVGILISFWETLFSGAMLVFGRVGEIATNLYSRIVIRSRKAGQPWLGSHEAMIMGILATPPQS